jgi:hypothetical protein
MPTLFRLDLARIRTNLAKAASRTIDDDEFHRELAARGVWRHSDEWGGANDSAAGRFAPGEILERRGGGDPSDDAKLDDQARRELGEETQRHREALSGLTARQVDAVVAEANRHLDRVIEIMRAMARRVADASKLLMTASLFVLCAA